MKKVLRQIGIWLVAILAIAEGVLGPSGAEIREGSPIGPGGGPEASMKPAHAQVGFNDTPFLPGGKWRVHDATRPLPPRVVPGTESTQHQPGRPPSDAIILFDGSGLSAWKPSRGDAGESAESLWRVENGYLEVVPDSGSLVSKQEFGGCQIHIEWAAPEKVVSSSQGRGNSGVLIMGKYEIQVLDSHDNVTYADGQAGAMYGQYPPLVSAPRPPGEWQVYDILFEAPRFEGERVVEPARVTVFHNGVALHHHQAFIGAVTHRRVARYVPHPPEGPLVLQDHGNPVRYRNIWVRPLGSYDQD